MRRVYLSHLAAQFAYSFGTLVLLYQQASKLTYFCTSKASKVRWVLEVSNTHAAIYLSLLLPTFTTTYVYYYLSLLLPSCPSHQSIL